MPTKRTTRPAAKRPARRRTTIRKAAPRKVAPPLTLGTLPLLGEYSKPHGGKFAGLARGKKENYLLFCAEIVGQEGTHAEALAAAQAYTDSGHRDFDGATQAEAALCYATCKLTPGWYWTKDKRAVVPSSGYIQSFYDGYQGWDPLGNRCRVFAVRRVPIGGAA